jgi:hypothetical protein
MSRVIKRLSLDVSVAYGRDEALGRFFDVMDDRYARYNEEGSEYIFEWSDKFGITNDVLNFQIDVNKGFDFKTMIQFCDIAAMFDFNVIRENPGDIVICDICGKDYSHSKEEGGFLFGSYAYCPECAKTKIQNIRKHNEETHIKAYCPKGISFKEWILKMRNGK